MDAAGNNVLVRAKPYAITAAVAVLALLLGRKGEVRNVVKALKAARGMRRVPSPSVD